jgi:hypothetical protein
VAMMLTCCVTEADIGVRTLTVKESPWSIGN